MKFYVSQNTYKHTYTLTHMHTYTYAHTAETLSQRKGEELRGAGGKEEQMKEKRKEIHSM